MLSSWEYSGWSSHNNNGVKTIKKRSFTNLCKAARINMQMTILDLSNSDMIMYNDDHINYLI